MHTMKWKLKDILMMAIAAAIFGVIYLGNVYLGGAITAALTPLGWGTIGYEPLYGIYFMAAPFVTYIVRKPGIGIIAEIIAAIVEVLLGNWFGPSVIITGILQGCACELVFLIARYKKWNMPVMMLSGVSVAVISFARHMITESYYLLSVNVWLTMLIIRIISSVIFAGILAKLLADALKKAGVLKGYAISTDAEELYEE